MPPRPPSSHLEGQGNLSHSPMAAQGIYAILQQHIFNMATLFSVYWEGFLVVFLTTDLTAHES